MQYLQVLNTEKYSTVPASQIDKKNDIQSNHSMIVGFLVNSIENPRSKVALQCQHTKARLQALPV